MFSRSKAPTISLPLYNNPRVVSRHNAHLRNRTRYMALGLFLFLVLVTFFALGRATPLIHNSPKWESALGMMENAAMFQSNLEAITDIYRGTEKQHGLEDMNHLVMVAGHAILLDKNDYLDDSAWVLESFQRGGQVQTFVDHILKGIEIAKEDNQSILIFSGGQTRPLAGPRSEGQSYWNLAHHIYRDDRSMDNFMLERVYSEEFARDSYENLLFSLCRFHEITGRYPDKITVIGFGFKEKRFTDLHRKAVRFPKNKFSYIGIDPKNANTQELLRLENANAGIHFENDPYACTSPVLTGKRLMRNPFRRMHGYGTTNPALLNLLSWCPETGAKDRWFDRSSLPWDRKEL